MANNPIQYTSRDFDSVINDINSDSQLQDKPNWFKRLIAGAIDVISMIVNAVANQSFLRTAFTRNAVKDHLELIDYTLTQQTTSSGTCIFYLNPSIVFPQTFLSSELTALSSGSLTVSSLPFESIADVTVSANASYFTYTSGNIFTTAFDFKHTGHKVQLYTIGTLPAPLQLSTDYYIIYVNSTTFSLATSIQNAYNNVPVVITNSGSGTFQTNLYSFESPMFQQKSKNNVILGNSDGITQWQEFNLPDSLVLDTSIEITILSNVYSRVLTFVNSLAIDKVFKTIPKSSSNLAIRFGNGVYGVIPPSGTIYANYKIGGGANSNISNTNKITIYSGGNSNIMGVSNCTVFNGGNDEELFNSAKINAPVLLKTRSTFVTVTDGVALAMNYGGLSLCQIVRNAYGALSCEVLGVATGGGSPNNTLRTNIQNYLISLSILQSVDVRFQAGTFSTITFTGSFHLLPNYTWSTVLPYITIAAKLFFSECGNEIQTIYNNQNISAGITRLNTIFSTSFSTTDSQISNLINNLTPMNFGTVVQNSDVITYIQANVSGIDYMSFSSPTMPLTLAADAITTSFGSTFNISQI